MLVDVLKEIKESGIFSKSDIAAKLNTSPSLIEDALSQLSRMGYVKIDNSVNECKIECSGCSFANSCNKQHIKSMIITKKGERLLDK